jgi:hypothetical protein
MPSETAAPSDKASAKPKGEGDDGDAGDGGMPAIVGQHAARNQFGIWRPVSGWYNSIG